MPSIVVRGEKLISRPIDVVRSHFVDMAHHADTRVHSTLDVSNVRLTPSGCRFTGRRRILGRLQENEYEVVRHPDGNSTLKCVEGASAGLTIAQTFEPQGDGATLVRLEVDAPVKGLLAALGPLVRFGIRKDLALALEEDRVDLEDRKYGAAVPVLR